MKTISEILSESNSLFDPLDVDTMLDIGVKYANEIRKIARKNDVGKVIGYFVDIDKKRINIVGDKAFIGVDFDFKPQKVKKLWKVE